MTAKQYRAALEALEMTQEGLGDLFRIGPRTSRRWAAGDARIPATAALLLKLMVLGRVKPQEIARLRP